VRSTLSSAARHESPSDDRGELAGDGLLSVDGGRASPGNGVVRTVPSSRGLAALVSRGAERVAFDGKEEFSPTGAVGADPALPGNEAGSEAPLTGASPDPGKGAVPRVARRVRSAVAMRAAAA
jgi:hypothetical protein